LQLPADPQLAPAWHDIRAELRHAVGDSTYDIWLAPLELKSLRGDSLLLEAPPATQSWVAKRFGRVLESCARSVLGTDVTVVIVATGSTPPPRGSTPKPDSINAATTTFNPRYTFDQFVIGDGNRLAHAASLAVAELPGQAYNPLFLHAPPGLGKTHLLHAIGNYARAFDAGATVRYTTVEAFTNNFITALSARSLDHFKRAYRDADILLIDDVQFLASKAKTEEEFFHTFNALHETGRQLVLTCDRLPRQLVTVEERLRERFESGLVTDIRPPDFATRVAILSKRAALDQIHLSNHAVLELIAERVTDNVRALEGALIRIVAFHSLTRRPIDLDLAATVLDSIYPRSEVPQTSVADVQTIVASFFELTTPELVSSSRAARVTWPRQLAMHLARELTNASLHDIGKAFGQRNHATVLHACKKVSDRIAVEDHATADLATLRQLITDKPIDRSC
jgi:chromosomal replication initiator protein